MKVSMGFIPGDYAKTATNLSPQWAAGCVVEVISWDDFRKGELATQSRFHWTLDEIRNGVFVRYIDGKRKGKVDMASEAILDRIWILERI